jgi:O-6-methylguanine DNA methyltransferase
MNALTALLTEPRLLQTGSIPLPASRFLCEHLHQNVFFWACISRIHAGPGHHDRQAGEDPPPADSLPLPATAQEVGGACAANVLAVAIPCHRVVKADGSISGYRWAVHRKRRLLKMEGVA